ncbi:histidine ammonia-lyase [Gloeobacter kilaueensis]|uniref:Histidine ammonia-lyase n=1 Tax=Gloeobacter kilaueensis (strain ATCC BAA-2537 / CCAP 1431/1 / ULC 316 / JS1) TaxID=1183438 RepID=U5QIE0_GLOK1|nr:histidine ammonia-lyase [Gloeobacter kilaueensis]AGY58757.1 histidine ammonia-lyase [Gloeobacter kilaueensis JS1]
MVPVQLDGVQLTIADVVRVARGREPVEIDERAFQRVMRSRAYVEQLVRSGQTVYGVTTGFGYFKNRAIGQEATEQLQYNLLLSHAAGVGVPLEREVVRAMLLLRANALACGYSGVRPETLQLLVAMLNRGVHPVIPSQGSVGASGDLAPLAHLALVLVGEGEAEVEGEILPGRVALERRGLAPIRLKAKEGLALINGTQVMSAIAALCLERSTHLLRIADIACAMTLEATLGSRQPYLPHFQRLRPHPGQLASARNLLKLTEDSRLIASHAGCDRIQDAYSLRCAPQVHGASRDAVAYAGEVVTIELNSATDNPLIFADEQQVLTGGHFHGQPVALAMDFLAIALSELANISERRTERLVNSTYSNGLPMFLAEAGGLHSGYMVAQYTAAALVSENKVLAHPASVDSIPTSAGQEDHVSMGTIAARKAVTVCDNCERVLAIELLCAAQGLDFRRDLPPGTGSRAAHAALRKVVPRLEVDRLVSADIERVRQLVATGELLSAVEQVCGPLE